MVTGKETKRKKEKNGIHVSIYKLNNKSIYICFVIDIIDKNNYYEKWLLSLLSLIMITFINSTIRIGVTIIIMIIRNFIININMTINILIVVWTIILPSVNLSRHSNVYSEMKGNIMNRNWTFRTSRYVHIIFILGPFHCITTNINKNGTITIM